MFYDCARTQLRQRKALTITITGSKPEILRKQNI